MEEKKTVLIVEDDSLIRTFLVNELSRRYNVVEASDSGSALDALEAQSIDLILLDILLPDESGFALLKRIKKRNSAWRNIPVVIISNFDDDKDIDEGVRLGAIEFLVKADYTPVEIANKVDKLLG